MTQIKEKEFIELDYTGKIKDTGDIFDTTSIQVAKDNNLFEEKAEYKPIVICVGQGQIIKGLDKTLPGKETEKEYTIEVTPDQAYGKRNAFNAIGQMMTTGFFHCLTRSFPDNT